MSSPPIRFSLIVALSLAFGFLSLEMTFGASKEIQFLNQGFDEETRQTFYHAPQGTRLLPYSWFLELEQATNTTRFLDDENLRRLGVIPDDNTLNNSDQLPVGFAKTLDPIANQTWVGLTCAACHTTEISYNNQTIRIDGGPSLFDALTFAQEIGKALDALVGEHSYDEKFLRFAKAVLKEQWSEVRQQQLRKELIANLKEKLEPQQVAKENQINLYPTAWGFGRLDAFGRGGNSVLFKLDKSNLRPADAPVSFPAIWKAWTLNRVQWNGAIMQPMGRNLGQAIGVNANVVLEQTQDQFRTSVSVKDLAEIEELVQRLQPPAWPSALFGAINQIKARRGSKLYEQHCAHCHVPKLTAPNKYGKQFKEVNLIPLQEIGTDPVSATNFHHRMVKTGPLGLGLLPVADTTAYLTSQIQARQYKELKIPEDQQETWNGYRPNTMQAPLAYIARPHSGVWALAPYLHNGSIPNLYQLLSPREERDNVFYVGHSEFDPFHVGFVTQKKTKTNFRFDTILPGNSNGGHEFRDGPKENGVIGPSLSRQDRWDLIEYLKTI